MDDRLAGFIESAQNRYWGKYRGFVADRADPDRLGRLRVRVPSLLADAVTGWAWPVTPYGGKDVGFLFLPRVDDLVWVEFAEGDLNHPLWTGCAWAGPGGRSEIPKEAADGYPDVGVLRTASGNVIAISDAGGGERIVIRSKDGCEIVVDAAAGRVTVRADEVIVRGAGGNTQELATRSFVQQVFDTHVHPTGVGPSGTPQPTSDAASLTKVLKAE